jgi:triphosphatase
VRRIGDRLVQTIKAVRGSQLFERDEWEDEIADESPDLRLARDAALEPLVSRKLWGRLKPVFETRVRRKTFCVCDGHRAIEIAVDRCRIDTGEHAQPLCEIELELKRGAKAALLDLAREVVDALPARLSVKSKAERGFALLDGTETTALKAAPVELRPDMHAGDGLRVIGRSCLRQVADNAPALEASDPEGVHQMRVGLRRLRAAMSLFRDLLTDAQSAALKRELKWLTKELAPARELEVLVQGVVVPVRRRHTRSFGSAPTPSAGQERRSARCHFAACCSISRVGSRSGNGRARRTISCAAASKFRLPHLPRRLCSDPGASFARKARCCARSTLAAATSCVSKARSCAMHRSSSPRCSRVERRRSIRSPSCRS